LEYAHDACNTRYRKTGWYQVPSGETLIPDKFSENLTGGYIYLYGINDNGVQYTEVDPKWLQINSRVHFDQCEDDNSNCDKSVGFRSIDPRGTYPGYFLTFHPDGTIVQEPPHFNAYNFRDQAFDVIGSGFVQGSKLKISWTYELDNGHQSIGHSDAYADPTGFTASLYAPGLQGKGVLRITVYDPYPRDDLTVTNSYPIDLR
jgi:hypothetical protein